MKKIVTAIILVLFMLTLVVGCTGPKEKAKEEQAKTPEQVAQEKYQNLEKDAQEVAKKFVLATQGDKEKIKELAFSTLLKEIEEKNWSIMLVDQLKIDPDSFEFKTEKLGDTQVLVNVFYKGKMKTEKEIIDVEMSNKIGIIQVDGKLVVFSVE